MSVKLSQIRDAWENRPAAGTASSGDNAESLVNKDSDVYTLAHAYVEANPDEFREYESKDLDGCVKAVEAFRAAGLEESYWRAQTWLFHKFPPQQIGGTVSHVIERQEPQNVSEN
jgi:hypothetical protein